MSPRRVPHFLAICGSLRAASSNLAVLQALADLARGTAEIMIFEILPRFRRSDRRNKPVQFRFCRCERGIQFVD